LDPAINSIKKGRSYLPQVLVFILIIALGGIWLWWVYHGDWVVQVNGYKIYEDDLDLEADRLQMIQESLGMDFQGEQGKALKEQLRQMALDQLVDRALMCQAARNNGISIDQADIENQLMVAQMQAGGAENLQKFLQEQGMTEEKYRELVEEYMMMEKLLDLVTKDVTVEEKSAGVWE
jgi:hypothetical protein